MRVTRKFNIIVLMCMGLLGAYWVACAQEVHSLWAPPPNLPQDDTALPSFPPLREQTAKPVEPATNAKRPLFKKNQTKVRSKMPPVVDVPGPNAHVQSAQDQPMKRQSEGIGPPPLPVPSVDNVTPLLPDHLAPLPPVTNANPQDVPLTQDKVGAIFPPPLPQIAPETQGQKKTVVSPNSLTQPVLPPKETPKPDIMHDPIVIPAPASDPKKALKMDPVQKEISPSGPANQIPALAPSTSKKGKAPDEELPTPRTIRETTAPEAPKSDRPKAFIRLRSTFPKEPVSTPLPSVPPWPTPMSAAQPMPGTVPAPVLSPGVAIPRSRPDNDSGAALVLIQTPMLNVEKRSLDSLRMGEAMQFQITVRNLSSIPAQQVRIEDILPPDAKVLASEPAPLVQGNKLIWIVPALAPQRESVIRVTLQAAATKDWTNQMSVQLSATNFANVQALPMPADGSDRRTSEKPHASTGSPEDKPYSTNKGHVHPQSHMDTLAVRLIGPGQVVVGKQAVFEISLTNQSAQAMQGIVLYGFLPQGLNTPVGRTIEGAVDGVLQAGETKTLKMPVSAVQPGRYPVEIKVTAQNMHEVSATTTIEIGADHLLLQPELNTRLIVGRDGQYRIELANHTSQVLRNVTVVSQLMDGLEFVSASDRGLYQANSRAVHWLIDQLPPGRTQPLAVHVVAAKVGQYQHHVLAKADGLEETRSNGTIVVEGLSDLSLKVIDRDNPLELGRETVYEVQVANPGTSPSTNVKLQVQFPPGLLPRNAQGPTRHLLDRHDVVFEPIAALGPQGQAIYRVSAVGQSVGNDQRVRFAVSSNQVRTPITREIGVMVYRD